MVCNPIANIVQQIIASKKIDTSHCYIGFVIRLQILYNRSSHPKKSTHCIATVFVILQMACNPKKIDTSHCDCFCNPIANIVQQIIASEKIDTSHCDRWFVILLQILYNRSSHPKNRHIALLHMVCNPIANIALLLFV